MPVREDIRPFAEAYIKRHEGCKLTPYNDVDAYSIGYGWHYAPGEIPPSKISQEEAERLFDIAYDRSVNHINQNIPFIDELDPARQAALVDMCYNMGIARLLKFAPTLQHMDDGEWNDVCVHIRNTAYYKQVRSRAEENISLFIDGLADGLPEEHLLPSDHTPGPTPPPIFPKPSVPSEPPVIERKSFWQFIVDFLMSIFGKR